MMNNDKYNKDPLEQLFRDKSNEFDLDFNEADWNDMESRLDQIDKLLLLNKQNSLMRRSFIAAAILLIILTVSFFTYRNYNRINELEQQLSQQSTNTVQDDRNSIPNKNSESNLLSQANNRREKGQAEAATVNSSYRKSPHTASEQEQLAEMKSNKTPKSFVNDVSSDQILKSNTVEFSGIQPVENLDRLITYAPEVIQTTTTSVAAFNTVENQQPPYAAALVEKSGEAASSAVRNANAFSGFAVGVTVGPDFSTVGSLSNFYTPGIKIGATVEYSLNHSFGISAGAVYSKVNYTASGKEYEPPYGFWDYGIAPQETIAKCAILAIPVRIKYNFARLGDSRMYVTAGVSSYIMLNEAYRFNYARNNTSHLVKSWSGETGTRHWLSAATISAGYEFDINRTLSLRVEPYLNIPLRNVGWGNVELFSTGSLISLNYHFQ